MPSITNIERQEDYDFRGGGEEGRGQGTQNWNEKRTWAVGGGAIMTEAGLTKGRGLCPQEVRVRRGGGAPPSP